MSYHARSLQRDQESQQRPCDDSNFHMAASAKTVLPHARRTMNLEAVSAAAEGYLQLTQCNPYAINARSSACILGGAANRSLAFVSCAGTCHSLSVYVTDAVFVAEATEILRFYCALFKATDGRVLAGLLLYLFDAPYAPAKEFILSGMQWLARCAFAMLNRIERQKGVTITEDQKLRILKLMHAKVHQSRRDVLAPAFPEGDATKTPLLCIVEVSAMPAPEGHPQAGKKMLPVLLGFVEPTNRKELTSYRAARFYDLPILQGWLTALLLHVGAAPPDNQDDLDVVRAMLGGPGGPTGGWYTYFGFDNDDRGAYAVLYGMSHGNVVGIPKDIAGELMSPAHTKGLHKLLDLNSYATRKLILEAAKRGRVCGDVQIIKLLRKRADFHAVDVINV